SFPVSRSRFEIFRSPALIPANSWRSRLTAASKLSSNIFSVCGVGSLYANPLNGPIFGSTRVKNARMRVKNPGDLYVEPHSFRKLARFMLYRNYFLETVGWSLVISAFFSSQAA